MAIAEDEEIEGANERGRDHWKLFLNMTAAVITAILFAILGEALGIDDFGESVMKTWRLIQTLADTTE